MLRTKDEDSINEVYNKYKKAEYIRDTYWVELANSIKELQEYAENLTGNALIDPRCKKDWSFERYNLSDVASMLERTKDYAQERISTLNEAMDEYRSDICGLIDDGNALDINGEVFEGNRGRGLCGMAAAV